MTKLTTERLEEIAKLEITEFGNGMDIAKDAYQSVGSSEIVLMARQLLAYEQAAKNPIAFTEPCEISNMKATGLYMRGFPDSKQGRNIPLYAAPILPKQPDGALIDEGTTAAPAQPVIPERALNSAKLINKFYERYPLETFANDCERAEALGYFMAGAELQCFGDFIAYYDPAQESENG